MTVSLGGHTLTLTEGVVACGAHGTACPLLTHTLTPLQRVVIQSAPDARTRAKLAYTALVENQVRAAMRAKGRELPAEWTVNLDLGGAPEAGDAN